MKSDCCVVGRFRCQGGPSNLLVASSLAARRLSPCEAKERVGETKRSRWVRHSASSVLLERALPGPVKLTVVFDGTAAAKEIAGYTGMVVLSAGTDGTGRLESLTFL